MSLLLFYIFIALGFSFLCSIAEAVLLSVSMGYISVAEQQSKPFAPVLKQLKSDVNKPLAAILTLNTIAHTVGAAGAGAQAAVVFGSAWVGAASAVLTLLILVFSEIIPKTLGAFYWRQLAPATTWFLKYLVWFLKPFVWLSEKLTTVISHGEVVEGLTRDEFAVMADLGEKEGQIDKLESRILRNLFRLKETLVSDIMTPRTVIYSIRDDVTVDDFFQHYHDRHFSRIPVYNIHPEHITGFVLRHDLTLARTRGNVDNTISTYTREMPVILDSANVYDTFDLLLREHAHIVLIKDSHGSIEGIATLEDVFETLLGLEIVDESDKAVDMQKLARTLWRKRAQKIGLNIEETDE